MCISLQILIFTCTCACMYFRLVKANTCRYTCTCTYTTSYMYIVLNIPIYSTCTTCINRFRRAWTSDKDRFIIRIRDSCPSVADFDAMFSKFSELGNKSQQMDTICILEFLMLDSSLLKFAIMTHVEEINRRLLELLMEIATNKLNELDSFIDINSAK